MSQLRLGRLPDGTRDIRILEPAVGRISHTRYGVKGGGEYVVPRYTRSVSDAPLVTVMKNPDNGAVKASTTEVQR